jgi:hypothetical protein
MIFLCLMWYYQMQLYAIIFLPIQSNSKWLDRQESRREPSIRCKSSFQEGLDLEHDCKYSNAFDTMKLFLLTSCSEGTNVTLLWKQSVSRDHDSPLRTVFHKLY